jgi:hypothetical protein
LFSRSAYDTLVMETNPSMSQHTSKPPAVIPGYRYQSPDIPLAAIRRFARQLGERFHPDRIILFGSYAYGQPNPGSDVDLLVVMPTSSEETSRFA